MNIRPLLAVLVLASLLACSPSEPPADAAGTQSRTTAAAQTTPPAAAPATEPVAEPPEPKAKAARKERPLPAFSGRTLAGRTLAVSDLLGKRLMIFFFNPEVKQSTEVAQAVARVAAFQGDFNFQVVGISAGSDIATTTRFTAANGLDFPIIDDSGAVIARQLGLQVPLAILGADAEGYVTFGMGQFPSGGPDDGRVIENMLRSSLRLPELGSDSAPDLGTRPAAPDFKLEILDSDETFELSEQLGRPVVLIFFLHTCPHCHEALAEMKKALDAMAEENRPAFIGIEVTGRTAAVREKLESLGLTWFPVAFDIDGSVKDDYGVFGGVPDTFLIDKQGRIAARIQGWREDADGPLLRMRLAQLAGAPVPMLLRAKGFSGNEVCGVCHENEHATWSLTKHSFAFDTLVKHGEATNAECVSCHVVGFGQPGGFVDAVETRQLENVGCESCHGRGGPHQSPGFVVDDDYEKVCVTCHDTKHSLGFEYGSFLPQISHAANQHLLALPLEEKRKLLAERGLRRAPVLRDAKYVGSDACRTCHSAEFATWQESGHAHAGETLVEKGKAGDDQCLACHTTALGKHGGFPEGADLSEHPDLGRVGCESCHGPGGDHVGADAVKFGTILSLGDKCDSCAITLICGTCHDDANDPGFEFEVQEKIDRQRHGTVEPGTGKPKLASEKYEGG